MYIGISLHFKTGNFLHFKNNSFQAVNQVVEAVESVIRAVDLVKTSQLNMMLKFVEERMQRTLKR